MFPFCLFFDFESKGNDSRRADVSTSCESSTNHGSSDHHAAIGLSDLATTLGSSPGRDSTMKTQMTIESGASLREHVLDPAQPSQGLSLLLSLPSLEELPWSWSLCQVASRHWE